MSKTRRKANSVSPTTASLSGHNSNWKTDAILILVVILLAFAIRYVSLGDVGVTFDEPIYTLRGIDYVDNLVHLNFTAQAWVENLEHPPVSKYIYGAASYLVHGPAHTWDAYGQTRLASVLMGVLTCVLVYLIGRDLLDRKTGFAAAIVLALLPTFIAHTQIAALESPLALFVTLTMYLYMLALKNESKKLLIASAVAFGLVVSTKYNGVIILPALALLFLAHRLGEIKAKEGRIDAGILKANLRQFVPVESVLIFLGISVILFFVLWPYLWSSPLANLQESLNHWTYPITEYFLGARVTPPLYYFPVYFAVTLPALLFIPLALGIWDAVQTRSPFKLGILLWFIVPFAYNFSSFIQDGIRYIFIIYPAVALLCAIGLARGTELVNRAAGGKLRLPVGDKAFAALTAVFALYLLITAMVFSPYYLDYYNELTGGPKNVLEHRLFEIGWWGEGLKECMGWVSQTAPADATVLMLTLPDDSTNTIMYGGDQLYIYPGLDTFNGTNKAYAFSREPLMVPRGDETVPVVPDYVIINQKMIDDFNVTLDDPGYTLVYQATVQGAPLAQVYRKADL